MVCSEMKMFCWADSRCSGIPFSAMRTGEWKILLAGDQVQVQRTINLVVGEPEVETVTVSSFSSRQKCFLGNFPSLC